MKVIPTGCMAPSGCQCLFLFLCVRHAHALPDCPLRSSVCYAVTEELLLVLSNKPEVDCIYSGPVLRAGLLTMLLFWQTFWSSHVTCRAPSLTTIQQRLRQSSGPFTLGQWFLSPTGGRSPAVHLQMCSKGFDKRAYLLSCPFSFRWRHVRAALAFHNERWWSFFPSVSRFCPDFYFDLIHD